MSLFALALVCPALLAAPEDPAENGFATRVFPFLQAHCFECHNSPEPAGELDLVAVLQPPASALETSATWRRVRRVLRAEAMPPVWIEDRPRPAEIAAVVAWIESAFPALALEDTSERRDTTLRRLNRRELEFALLDLFGVAIDLNELLPADGVSHGFDVIGETLTLSPAQFETLFEIAERVAEAALPPAGADRTRPRVLGAADLETGNGNRRADDLSRIILSSNGQTTARVALGRGGEYEIRIRAGEQHAGPDPARMDLLVNGQRVERFDVTAPVEEPALHVARAQLGPGEHTFAAGFINDYFRREAEDPADRDRNLHVYSIEISGPRDAERATPFELRFRPGERSLQETLDELARLVWRDAVSAEDLRQLAQLAGETATDRERLRGALTALIASPRFLFRLEPPGTSDGPSESGRPLRPGELATRLAAFLWSSVPDEQLLAAGAALDDPRLRRAEVERMLRDARASRLARTFATQWLQLGRLDSCAPDPALFPAFDDGLRRAMRLESELFFDAILREGRPVSELISANFTFVDERLAKHYGIPGVRGDAMQRVAIPMHLTGRRGGLLGQAGLLTASSNPNRTSPVLRGKWVLEALLATPPSPPPPGVGALDEDTAGNTAASLREQLERHRADAACATCHAPMDGLGFAPENYDAIGAWREKDGADPIDARGRLPGPRRANTGTPEEAQPGEGDDVEIEGPTGLAGHLLRERRLTRGLTRHLATFALGRALTAADRHALDSLLDALGPDPALAELVAGIVGLQAFERRYR